jgi:hypothetical protein
VTATPNGETVGDLILLIGHAERTWWRQLLGPLLLGSIEGTDTTVEVFRRGDLLATRAFRSGRQARVARDRLVAELRAMPVESLTEEVVEERLRAV